MERTVGKLAPLALTLQIWYTTRAHRHDRTMTHYDKLIDALVQHLYDAWEHKHWDEQLAKRKAHEILTTVEAFQQNRLLSTTDTSVYTQWRASDWWVNLTFMTNLQVNILIFFSILNLLKKELKYWKKKILRQLTYFTNFIIGLTRYVWNPDWVWTSTCSIWW